VLMIIRQMTFLAERPEVFRIVILRRVIQVRDRQDHARAGNRMRLVVLGAAGLALMAGPIQDRRSDLFPVLRVPGFVLGFYWHQYSP